MPNVFDKKYIYAPVRVLLFFNVFTLFVYVFGPVAWQLKNEFVGVLYILLNLTILYIGYKWGVVKYRKNSHIYTFEDNKKKIHFIILFTFIWFLPMVCIRLGIMNFNISDVIKKMIDGLNNPLIVYQEKLQSFEDGEGKQTPRLQIFDGLVRPITYAFFSISILFFNQFNRLTKIGVVIIFLLECLSWISIGTNKGLADVFLFIFFMGLAVSPQVYRLNLKKIIVIILAIGLVLAFFINTMLSRFGVSENESAIEKIDFNVLGNPLKTSYFYEQMNIGIKFALMQITSYLSQGYYTLSLAINEPFTWSYGFGNSWLGLNLWGKFTGKDLMQMTYMGSLERNYGIDSKVAWYSIYTWLASDFTFVGVPFIMYAIGYGLAVSWLDTIYKRTIYASIVFCLLTQMIFYFFANNSIISFAFLPFIVFVTLWIKYR